MAKFEYLGDANLLLNTNTQGCICNMRQSCTKNKGKNKGKGLVFFLEKIFFFFKQKAPKDLGPFKRMDIDMLRRHTAIPLEHTSAVQTRPKTSKCSFAIFSQCFSFIAWPRQRFTGHNGSCFTQFRPRRFSACAFTVFRFFLSFLLFLIFYLLSLSLLLLEHIHHLFSISSPKAIRPAYRYGIPRLRQEMASAVYDEESR